MAVNKVIYDGQTLIDLTGDTITADNVLSAFTFHDKSGAEATGTCTFDADTKDADATAAEILATKTAYVNGQKVIGSMANNGQLQERLPQKTEIIPFLSASMMVQGKLASLQGKKPSLLQKISKKALIFWVLQGHLQVFLIKHRPKPLSPQPASSRLRQMKDLIIWLA